MWRKHPLASLGFYINFSFPIFGPILAAKVFVWSVIARNFLLFLVFMLGFVLVGVVFALFVRIYRDAKDWLHMPLFSILFVSALIWQMPYALITLRRGHWGTR